MFLKEFTKSHLITINYYQDGVLQTRKGRVYNLDPYEQTVSLKDENQQVYAIRFSGIRSIC
jgi:hypothetical protein